MMRIDSLNMISKRLAAVLLILSATLYAADAQGAKFELRCGWYDNPTPGNHSLYDKEGEWIIGVQGGYQLEDFSAPLFKANQWVETPSGSYGYGCACFRMRVDKETKHVLEIKSSAARPLSVCRNDRALKKKWDFER
jgi:hypothetical protein